MSDILAVTSWACKYVKLVSVTNQIKVSQQSENITLLRGNDDTDFIDE